MKTYNLDTIQKVPLREVWPHEAHDFTKWLAEEQNLATLGMAVGIELELIETESSVGSFNVDIYAQESGTGRKVIIENQLEDTNHDHLGKVITYAAGKGAEVVIWVVAHARDEHRQAIECSTSTPTATSGSSWSRSSSGRSGTPCPPRASAWSSSRTSGPRP